MRRRTILVAAGLGAAGVPPAHPAAIVRWYVGENHGRTDPFVTWTMEVMQARFALRVRPTHQREHADLVTVARSADNRPGWHRTIVQVAAGAPNPAGARQLAAFLATATAPNLATSGHSTVWPKWQPAAST